MEKYIAVALGGAVGALCRMALGEWVMTKVTLSVASSSASC